MLIALLLLACPDSSTVVVEGDPVIDISPPTAADYADEDGDGYSAVEGDCDDNNINLSPTATDIVGDGIDQNCDGVDGTDADGDHTASVGSGGTDCEDDNPDVYPKHTDIVCDGVDNNCNGDVDEQATFANYFLDADGDGYGTEDVSVYVCEAPEGYVLDNTDCTDSGEVLAIQAEGCDGEVGTEPVQAADIHPGAEEVYLDGVDQDCSGGVELYGMSDFDADGDGYPVRNDTTEVYFYFTDCNDCDAGINPGALEDNSDEVNNNCAGGEDAFEIQINWGVSDLDEPYTEVDLEGHGDFGGWGETPVIFGFKVVDVPTFAYYDTNGRENVIVSMWDNDGLLLFSGEVTGGGDFEEVKWGGTGKTVWAYTSAILAEDAMAGEYTYKVETDSGSPEKYLGGGCWVWGYNVSDASACTVGLNKGDTTGWTTSGRIIGTP